MVIRDAGYSAAPPRKANVMKKLIAAIAFCLASTAPSFAAEHVVTRTVKVAGKDSYKAGKYSVKETGKLVKVLF